MSDLISRQAAIDALEKIFPVDRLKNEYTQGITVGAALATEYIEQLPSAQPERKKGSWNVIQGDIVVCSKCGMLAPKSMTGCLLNRHLEPNRTNFCPNCGADMRGEQDG